MRPSSELTKQLCFLLSKSNSALPRYKQLYEALRQQILEGLLLPGMCLPSSRVLAKELGLARITVLTAIEQLCVEGYARAHPKSGVYILPTTPLNWDTHNKIATKIKLGLSRRGQRICELATANPMRGAFALGIPDLQHFPFELWQRYLTRHARNPKLNWQTNLMQGGDLELRQVLVDYLRAMRGIICDVSQLLMTQGTQHSLRLVADLLADPGDSVWMEDPGYLGARCAFETADLVVVNQPVDDEGLSPKNNAWKKPPRFIYVTPSHQFPTGVIMSAARRRHLLALAAQHQTCIIEDDYDGEFRYAGSPLAALQALAPKQVIYLGTFSKTFYPSIRIGYMVLPESLATAFCVTQARHLREPSYITQRALADFMRDGHASAHIRKIRREYQFRRDLLVDLLKRELGDHIRLSGLDTGLHLIAYLPSGTSDKIISAKAYQNSVMTTALTQYNVSENSTARPPALLLGFGDTNEYSIRKAGKMLARIISQYSS